MKINKKEAVEAYLESPYEVGDRVYVRGLNTNDKNSFITSATIYSIEEDNAIVLVHGYRTEKVSLSDLKKNAYNIGFDPFDRKTNRPKTINFGLESILSVTLREREYINDVGVPIKPLNWNPYVTINNEKMYYQRDFVWTLEQKQSFIDSIYNEMDCGKIIIRKYEWGEVANETDPEKCYFNDIVDGKQRLSTIQDFLNDGFSDSYGYLFSELSDYAQNTFKNSQSIGYAQFEGYVSDEDILKQFLMINHTGVPQSKEHIEYVKELLNKVKQ